MVKVTIPAKSLQRIRQAAKDLHSQNVTASISKNSLIFEIGDKKITLEGVNNGDSNRR